MANAKDKITHRDIINLRNFIRCNEVNQTLKVYVFLTINVRNLVLGFILLFQLRKECDVISWHPCSFLAAGTKSRFAEHTTASHQRVTISHHGPCEAAQSVPQEGLQGNAINGEVEPVRR